MIIALLFLFNIDLGGYIDNRPYVGFTDSVSLGGYARGWIRIQSDYSLYGAEAALDILAPYDTLLVFSRNRVEISRLAAWFGPYNFRATLGRQLVDWGTARVFKCLDFFNPVNYFEPGYQKTGLDAIQAQWAFSPHGSVRFLCRPMLNPERSLGAGRLASALLHNDIGLNFFYRKEPALASVGFDMTGEMLIGYWAEGAYWQNDSSGLFKMTCGIDYTLPGAVYLMAEYFHDASGQPDPAFYDYGLIHDGIRSTLAQNYLYLSTGIVPNMYIRPAINAIINLDDRGVILLPTLLYALLDNADLTAGANIPIGVDDSEFRSTNPYAVVVYAWLKVYF